MTAAPASHIRISFLLLLIFSCSFICHAQQTTVLNCKDTINIITDAYNAGQWTVAKHYAKAFIYHSKVKESTFFLSTEYRIFNYKDCDGQLAQVYYYLIKSYNRLFETDSAAMEYQKMLQRGLNLNKDSLENDLGRHYKTSRLVVSLFAGVDNPLTKYNYKFGFQLGVGHTPLFFELAYRNKYFDHVSDQVSGGFGKILAASSGVYPKYKFDFTGHEHLIESAYFAKFPLRLSAYMPRLFFPYSSLGIAVSYYINTSISKYQVDVSRRADSSISYASGPGRSLKRIDELNMDLTSLYTTHFSYGAFGGLGGCFILRSDLVLFCEARYYVGTNYRYKYDSFNTFRPGVNCFSFTVGIAKSKSSVKVIR